MTRGPQHRQAFSIRPLLPGELEAAARLLPSTNDGVALPELEADLRRNQERWPRLQLGAFESGRLVGIIAGRMDRSNPSMGWSDDIVVSEAAQGRGLGSRLLGAQLEAFRALGCDRVRGLSPRKLFPKVAFFERHGFKVIEKTVSQGLWGIADGEPLWVTEFRFPTY